MKQCRTVAVWLGIACLFFIECARTGVSYSKPVIIATTTHIETILTAIANNRVSTTVFVPGGMCPGHFDITPKHVALLEKADILIMHGWEQWASDAIEAAGNRTLRVVKLETAGNAMLPQNHISIAREIAAILCKGDSSNCHEYTENLHRYLKTVADTIASAQRRGAPLHDVPVVCSEHQKDFLVWLGCRVAAVYGRPEAMTPSELGEVAKSARESGARIVVDNMQSGPRAGYALAGDIGAAHRALSNFPLNGSYTQTLIDNVHALLNVVENEK
jgi:ABC-type Zn uptake system ZnuABC Zn-binding protein ZnuA